MDHYGQDNIGDIKIQSVPTLPEFVSAAQDERRLIYCEDTEKRYIGTSTEWKELGVGGVFVRGGTLVNTVDFLAAMNVIVWYATCACVVTNVRGYRVGGTGATVNARLNGTDNHLASAVSLVNADTWYDGGAVQNTAYVTGDKLEIMVVGVTGDITQIAIQVDFIQV
ncbi:hypothetical protein KKE60_05220 [Patescibacteria group bacterium]|nr:hypothetical protein [Patescibacteria group bacterium]